MMKKGLTAQKVLRVTAGRLAGILCRGDLEGKLITFAKPAFTEIADDSDGHRTKKAHMDYRKGVLVTVANQPYFIGSGVHEGNYPGGQYRGDLMILPLKSESLEEGTIKDAIRESEYFANSPLIAMEGGDIGIGGPENKQSELIKKLGDVSEFIQRQPEYASGLISFSTLEPVVTKSMTYRKIFPRFLAQVLREVYFK